MVNSKTEGVALINDEFQCSVSSDIMKGKSVTFIWTWGQCNTFLKNWCFISIVIYTMYQTTSRHLIRLIMKHTFLCSVYISCMHHSSVHPIAFHFYTYTTNLLQLHSISSHLPHRVIFLFAEMPCRMFLLCGMQILGKLWACYL